MKHGEGTVVVASQPGTPSLEELYRRDYRRLVALAHGLSGSRAAAEELVQDAFLAAHRTWGTVGGYADPSAWLRRVVVNRSVSRIRRRVAEGRALARLGGRRDAGPDELAPADAALWAAVRGLPRRQRQVVALYYVDDLSVGQVAAVLECAPGTVKAHLHAARQSLGRTLGHPAGEPVGETAGLPGEPGHPDAARPADVGYDTPAPEEGRR